MDGIAHKSLFITFGLSAFFLNIIETVLIWRKRKTWKPFDRLLLSLSFADMIVSTVAVVLCFTNRQDLSLNLLICSGIFSVFHILAITFDRCMAIKKPLQHSIKMKGKRPYQLICAVWVSSTVLVTVNGIVLYLTNAAQPLMKFVASVLLLLGILYAAAYKHMFSLVLIQAVKSKKNKGKDGHKKCQLKKILVNSDCKRERTLLVTCILVVVSYIVCMYPVCLEVLIRKALEEVSFVTQLFMLANSIANPLVYFYKGTRDRRTRKSTGDVKLTTSGSSKQGGTKGTEA